jgi:hypothetical protein
MKVLTFVGDCNYIIIAVSSEVVNEINDQIISKDYNYYDVYLFYYDVVAGTEEDL